VSTLHAISEPARSERGEKELVKKEKIALITAKGKGAKGPIVEERKHAREAGGKKA